MRYFKNVSGDYITSISTESGEIEISKLEYNQILNVIRSRPTPPEGYDYLLHKDLTWELVELPPVPELEVDE